MFRRPLHPLIGPLAALAVLVASFAVAYWAPWSSDTRERELEYLETLSAWLAEVPQRGEAPDECIANFDRRVGEAPSQRIRPAARIARAGCGPARSDTHWLEVEWDVQSNLIDRRFAAADTTPEPGLATVVRDVVHTAHVNCWLGDDWEPLVQEWGIFARGEFWGLLGFADKPRRAIHLSPEVCDPLHRFFKSSYTPYLNEESLRLAEALVTLVHEAEHLHHPYAPEAVVECYAMQGVRQVVVEAGRQPSYANEMALLAFDIAYPHEAAAYRTRRCRDGGRLDLHPRSSLWP